MASTDRAAELLRRMKADPTKRRPSSWTPTLRQNLIDALEEARKAVCAYGPLARTCDCKYGLVPDNGYDWQPAMLGSEQTGCPELRDLIRAIRAEMEPNPDVALAAAGDGESA